MISSRLRSLVGDENRFARLVLEQNGAVLHRPEIALAELPPVDQRQRQPVGQHGAKLLHQIEREARPAGPVAMQKAYGRIEADRLRGDLDKRRLRRVARACLDWGQRVQFSVFECEVDPAQWTMLRNRLLKEIDAEADSLRFYFLGANWRRRIEHAGAKPVRDPEGPLIW